jgi:hypothetical protein
MTVWPGSDTVAVADTVVPGDATPNAGAKAGPDGSCTSEHATGPSAASARTTNDLTFRTIHPSIGIR